MPLLTRRHLLVGAGALAVSPAGVGTYAIGIEPMVTVVTRYRLTPPGWPLGLSLRIAALADLHACEPFMSAARLREIALATNALAPDLTVLLGDYTGGHDYVTGPVTAPAWGDALSVLRAPLGVYGILGNHDWWHGALPSLPADPDEVRRGLRSAGARVLENDLVRLAKNRQPFWLAGLADQMAYRRPGLGPRGADDLPGTLKRVTDEAPIVMLIHEPYLFPAIPARVAVTLCGHTHGGQVRVPGLGAPFTPSRDYLYGHVVERDRHLIVSGGLGESGFPARLGVPPEIVVLDLGPGQPTA